jgi:hypothetical protein
MAALDEKPIRARSGRSIYYGGDTGSAGGDMTDYQQQSLEMRQAATSSNESFRQAEAMRRAEEAAQKATATDSRFRDTMEYRRGTQAAAESRFQDTMDYRRSAQAGVQSRFDQAQALREEMEARRQENDERTALQSARRLKLDVDKDARAIEFEEKKFQNVESFDKEVSQIEEMWGDDPVRVAAMTVAAARKFPLATEDKRTFSQVDHSSKLLEKWQVHPKLPTALWEASEFDPRTMDAADARQYLGTIAAKYPEVANDSTLAATLKAKMEQVDMIESKATKIPDGMEPSSTTIGTDGKRSVTYRAQKEAKDTTAKATQEAYKMAADNLAKAQDDRNAAQKEYDALDQKKDKSGARDVIKKLDKVVDHWQTRFNKEEAAWDENRGGATAAPAAGAKTIEITPEEAAGGVAPAPAANAAAIEWLKANPNDPRATAIKAKLGLQ